MGALDWLASDRAEGMAATLVRVVAVVLVAVRRVVGVSQEAGVVTASVATGTGVKELLRAVEDEEREDVVTGDVMVLAVARREGEEREASTLLPLVLFTFTGVLGLPAPSRTRYSKNVSFAVKDNGIVAEIVGDEVFEKSVPERGDPLQSLDPITRY
jgi:hypothetical protein